MHYYSLRCEAPGGYGPTAVLRYNEDNPDNIYIEEVEYLDLEFRVWLGSEVVQHVESVCVSKALWKYLVGNGIRGVGVRDMTVTPRPAFPRLDGGKIIPPFVELVLERSAEGEEIEGSWRINESTIPDADMFSGLGLPLCISERAKDMFVAYGVTGVEYREIVLS